MCYILNNALPQGGYKWRRKVHIIRPETGKAWPFLWWEASCWNITESPCRFPEGLRERYCSWFLYCFIRVRRAYTGRSFWICFTEMVNAPILRGVYGLRYSGSANFWRVVSCRHGNISAQTEESTDGMAGNCRCTLMPGILRIRQRWPCATMMRHSWNGPAVCIRGNFWPSLQVRNGYQWWESAIRSFISAVCGLPAVSWRKTGNTTDFWRYVIMPASCIRMRNARLWKLTVSLPWSGSRRPCRYTIQLFHSILRNRDCLLPRRCWNGSVSWADRFVIHPIR